MMKIAVSTYSLTRWREARGDTTLDATLMAIAELGVAGVEFVKLDSRASEVGAIRRAEELRKRCEELGLGVAGYCVGAELLVAPSEQPQRVESLKHQVEIAAALGAKTMRHDVTRGWEKVENIPGPRTFAAALRVVVPAIREVAEFAQAHGVKTSLENHGFYMQAAVRIEKTVKAVAHPNFGLTLDTGNFFCVADDPVAAVRRLAKYAVMVHLKDFHVKKRKAAAPKDGWFPTPKAIAIRGAILGHGDIDIPAQLALLRRARYNGWLSLEFEGIEESMMGVKMGLAYLRETMAKFE